MGLHGLQFRNNKTYNDCDFIRGIRRPEIIIYLQRRSKSWRAANLKTNPEVQNSCDTMADKKGSNRY
jgi:hypothetical protein